MHISCKIPLKNNSSPTAGIIAEELLDFSLQVWDTGHIFEFASENFIEKELNSIICQIIK